MAYWLGALRISSLAFAVSGLSQAAANSIHRQGDSIDSCHTITRSRGFQRSACALSAFWSVDAAGFGRHRLFWFPYDLAFAGLLTQAWIMHVNGSRTWPIRRPVLSALVLQDPKGVYLRPASHHALRALSCLVLPMLDLGPEPVPLLALQGRQRCGNACAATPSPSASTHAGRAVQ